MTSRSQYKLHANFNMFATEYGWNGDNLMFDCMHHAAWAPSPYVTWQCVVASSSSSYIIVVINVILLRMPENDPLGDDVYLTLHETIFSGLAFHKLFRISPWRSDIVRQTEFTLEALSSYNHRAITTHAISCGLVAYFRFLLFSFLTLVVLYLVRISCTRWSVGCLQTVIRSLDSMLRLLHGRPTNHTKRYK